jgi:TonB-dependent starch-binding outer membrane protein SusC
MKESFYKHLKYLLLQMFLLLIVFPSYAQERTVTGQITSVDEPGGLPGVNIQLKGTMQGTITDANGRYTIATSGENSVLVFSSVGYES